MKELNAVSYKSLLGLDVNVVLEYFFIMYKGKRSLWQQRHTNVYDERSEKMTTDNTLYTDVTFMIEAVTFVLIFSIALDYFQ